MLDIHREGNSVTFTVRVQPRATRSELAGCTEGVLRVLVHAPPVKGAANDACRVLLAEKFGVSKSCVEIISGHKGRTKRVRVTGAQEEKIREILLFLRGSRRL